MANEYYTCPSCYDVHTIRIHGVNNYGEHGSACPKCGTVYEIPEANKNQAGHMARAFAANPVIINPTAPRKVAIG